MPGRIFKAIFSLILLAALVCLGLPGVFAETRTAEEHAW